MTDFRVLCADLLAWAEKTSAHYYQQPDVLVRARAGLPQPEPEGRPAPAEVAAWLRAYCSEEFGPLSDHPDASWLTRAADLLERQAAPVPVPLLPEGTQVIEPSEHTILVPVPVPVAVSERMPEVEDCDAEGRCWWWRTDDADEWWEFLCITDAREYNAGCGSARYTHWLPAHALPLPSGEVEA